MLRSSANSLVIFDGLYSNYSLKASLLSSDERSGLGSFLTDVSPEETLKTYFDLGLSNDTLAINDKNFLCYFCSAFAFLKLPQHYKSNKHFQFFCFRVVRSLIRL